MKSIYDCSFLDKNGNLMNLQPFEGKVLLIVNIASKCAYTPQLEGLQKLHEKYHSQGFSVLGFPSNDFANQEPLTDASLQEFCMVNYGVSFPVFAKSHVRGSQANELFKYLNSKTWQPFWNFQKYLIGKNGEIINYFFPFTSPLSNRVCRNIEKLVA